MRLGRLLAFSIALTTLPMRPSLAREPEQPQTDMCRPNPPPEDAYGWSIWVFFDLRSAMLSAPGMKALDGFLALSREHAFRAVSLVAGLDGGEQTPRDSALRKARIGAVAGYLVAHGFDSLGMFRQTIYTPVVGIAFALHPVIRGVTDPQNRSVHLEVVGEFLRDKTLTDRILSCRSWVLAKCLSSAPATLVGCKKAIDFLIIGDEATIRLWQSEHSY